MINLITTILKYAIPAIVFTFVILFSISSVILALDEKEYRRKINKKSFSD